MGPECKINHAIAEKEPGALVFSKRIESLFAPGRVNTRSGHACRKDDRTAELLCARCDVESMQPLWVARTLFSLSNHVNRSTCRINYRRAGYPNLNWNVAAFAYVSTRNRCYARLEKTYMPQWSGAKAVRIEGVNAVIFGCNIHYVMETAARDIHASHIKGRRKSISVYRIREEFSKLNRVNVCRSQHSLIVVLSRSEVIVVESIGTRIVADIDALHLPGFGLSWRSPCDCQRYAAENTGQL